MVYGDKVYTNFRGSNVAEDGVEVNLLQRFTSIHYLLMKIYITSKYI